MKLLKSIFVLIMIVSLASCGSDDDNNHYALNNANVAGTYDLVFYESKEVKTTVVSGVDIITETTQIGSNFQYELVFSGNGHLLSDGQYLINYKIVVADEVTEEDSEIIDVDSEESTYSTNNTTMTMVIDGDTYSVTNFNKDEIKLSLEKNYTEDGDEVVYTEEIKLVRQQ